VNNTGQSVNLKYFSTGPYLMNRPNLTHHKRRPIDPGNVMIMNEAHSRSDAGAYPDTTTADESLMHQERTNKADLILHQQGNDLHPARRKKSKRVRRKTNTHLSREIQRLKEQLHDDKNFIFNSQSQFGFTSADGYNFTPAKFNKHSRGLGNNRVMFQSQQDRCIFLENVIRKNQQTSQEEAASQFVGQLDVNTQ
jgi:hypothetical protein